MSWAAIAVGAVSIGVGVVKGAKAKKESKKLLAQREAYQTPDEVYEVLNATQANAQMGFDPATLSYLTNQTDNAFAGSIATAERLGADPNALSAIFGQKINGIMEIGAQNHQMQMQNFSAYLNALSSSGASSAAEQKSQQDLLRDELQVVAQDKQVASGQISQGVNSVIAGASMYGMDKLYNPQNRQLDKFNKAYGNQGDSAYAYAQDNSLSYRQYQEQLKKNLAIAGSF